VETIVVNTKHLEAEASFSIKEGWRNKLSSTQFLIELAHTLNGKYEGRSLDNPNIITEN
jgi:hypothetical protein